MEEYKRKISKMGDELIKFLLNRGSKKVSLELEDLENEFIITAKSKVVINEEELNELILNYKAHKDMEYDYFWELVGDNSDEDELELLFMLADNVRIYYDDKEGLSFIVEIKK
ncbi:hypothetical protein [Oceanivirga salmonicida]|uniref:hypothetical protein n=1 Tax=Oceanivirga salmonicida TaxID=1769291 RepID=UPI000831EAEF|nr:hypothetical protein [Oceanivirga salmonicida]